MRFSYGEVSEWFKVTVSKTVVRLKPHRGFESHPLRHTISVRDAVLPRFFIFHLQLCN